MNWDVLNRMGCNGKIDDMLRIRLHEAGSNEDIFTYVAWIRAFNIMQNFAMSFIRLMNLTNLSILEFAQRLGLYQAVEHDEEGFNVYFEGGLRGDEYFNAQEYWLSISQEDNLGLSRNHTSTIKNPILRVIHKMIC
ncbi:hypothetical protein Tco_0018504 [Tanacetum coccineum]